MRRIGLAVSGGADSTALLVLMAELQAEFDFEAIVLHVDHGLRLDSAEDADFVQHLAQTYDLPFHALKTRVVRRPRESLEMAARRVRLAFFSKMTKELGLDAIATGHHADDVAETFILRLARGSGPEGLAGLKQISHVDGITFIRPLLNVRDRDLRGFLQNRGILWREDSTNVDTSILRNKVRHVILPFLRANLDAHITEHLCKSAAILRGDLKRAETPQMALPPTPLPERRFSLQIEPATGYSIHPTDIGTLPATCELSRAVLAGRTLEMRPWRAGDRIAPLGMGGKSRKIQDVYVTAKVPPETRATLPLLIDAQTNEVLWVPGYRIAESVAATSQKTPTWRFILTEIKS